MHTLFLVGGYLLYLVLSLFLSGFQCHNESVLGSGSLDTRMEDGERSRRERIKLRLKCPPSDDDHGSGGGVGVYSLVGHPDNPPKASQNCTAGTEKPRYIATQPPQIDSLSLGLDFWRLASRAVVEGITDEAGTLFCCSSDCRDALLASLSINDAETVGWWDIAATCDCNSKRHEFG
jgi:hypothetical protein